MAVAVLMPEEAPKVIKRTEGLFPDLGLSLMGPPVEEKEIIEWCKTHLNLLDPQALKVGLFGAFQKTVTKNGYSAEIQKISKTRFVRLTTGLIKEGVTIIKEE
jgi:hypothetical protein